MENSISSCSEAMDSGEESGWTQYIDDFSPVHDDQMEHDELASSGSGSLGYCVTTSMVSDAGSNPEWKQKLLHGLPRFPKKLNFKMKRAHEISCDDSLEDTASSPINSPKITMNFMSMNLNSRQDIGDNKNDTVEDDICEEKHTKYNFINHPHDSKIDMEFTELEKKGLCLVPISMVINNFH